MWSDTALTRLCGIELPIVQAPLGGGPGTAELTAAVSGAGGLGVLGAGYLPPEQIRQTVRRVRALTDRPFASNLFLVEPARRPDPDVIETARRALVPFREDVGLDGSPTSADLDPPDVRAQLEVLLGERVPVIGFTFGVPGPDLVESAHATGLLVAGTATTPAEAVVLHAAGVDLIVAQGAEAGGHRGGFLPDVEPIGLAALVPAVVDAVDVPVVATGGIMDGRGIAAALALGAAAAQLGTAFLRTPEAATNPAYRSALAAADAGATVLTDRFTGKPARGIRNCFIDALADIAVPPYPVMHALTRELRAQAARLGRSEYLSLWAGQGVGLGRDLPAAQLVRDLAAEVEQTLARLTRAPRCARRRVRGRC
jgi:nitronate monooxygenase